MIDLVLRAMGEADLDRVHELEVASSPTPWSRALLAGELEGDCSDRIWLVATTAKAELIGFGGVLIVAEEAHVMNLVVDRAHRRLGVASRLLATLLLEAVERGAHDATLEVRASNQGARSLYEQHFGFVLAGRRPDYYRDHHDRDLSAERDAAVTEDALILWSRKLHKPDRFSHLQHLSTSGVGNDV